MRCTKPTCIVGTILALFVIVFSVFLTTATTEYRQGFGADGRIYGVMAGEASFPSDLGHTPPWCYRILSPYIASLLPWSVLDNFRVLAFVSDILCLLLLLLILRALNLSRQVRIVGLLLYCGVFWTLKFSFYSPAYIDYQTQLFLLLIIYLTVRGSFVILLPVLVLAVLQRESLAALSLVSAASILRRARSHSPVVAGLLIVSVLSTAALALLLLRHLAAPWGSSRMTSTVIGELRNVLHPAYWLVLLHAAFSGLGLIPVLLAVHYGRWVGFLRREWEWGVYAVISVAFLFGGRDKARLFLYFLPLAVILASQTVSALREFARDCRFRFAVWALVVLGAHWYIGNYFAPIGPRSEFLAKMVAEHSNGSFVPYLVRNSVLVVVIFVFTVQYVIGGWYFRPAIGFTRRVPELCPGADRGFPAK
jgi:hypothetical protein